MKREERLCYVECLQLYLYLIRMFSEEDNGKSQISIFTFGEIFPLLLLLQWRSIFVHE